MIRNRCFEAGPNFDNAQMPNKDMMSTCMDMNMQMPMNDCIPPVYECPQERCCHRQIHYQVKHIIPVNTRIMNHHIIHHSYVPMYTCCEENDCCNVYDNKCGM